MKNVDKDLRSGFARGFEADKTNHADSHLVGVSRREFVAAAGGSVAVFGISACAGPTSFRAPADELANPLYYSTTRALASAIREGQLAAEEVVSAFIDRINEVNPVLNAVVQMDAESALSRAREADAALSRGEPWGALHGVPMTIKDSLDTAGMISTGGTRGRASFVPSRDATVVARLRNAGAILLGKTNTPELTLSFETDNLVYGRTNNPYDLERTPGGSSGGAAAIIAAGGAPFDIGSDYGGSIRLPAHFCGIAGIKPSAGRVPRTGHIYPFGGIQDSFQQIGPLARDVDDLIYLLPLIMGPDRIDPSVVSQPWTDPETIDLSKLRVAFHADNGVVTPTAEIVRAVQSVALQLESDVGLVEERRPTGIDRGFDIGLSLFNWDGGAAVTRLLSEAGTTEHTLQGFTDAEPLDAEELDLLIAEWYDWRSEMLSFLQDYDVIICPVNALVAGVHGSTAGPDALPAFSYTMTYNLTGWPGAVVRAGTSSEGLPIGVQIVTAPGREDIALAVAGFVESSFGGFQRPTI